MIFGCKTNMDSYEIRRKFGDKVVNHAKRIIGLCIVENASFETDTQQATDLIVNKNLSIALRTRQYKYLEQYQYEFTIRSSINSNARTELSKILSGYGDWMFYGFVSKDETSICQYMIIDLNVFRDCYEAKSIHPIQQTNKLDKDGAERTTQFMAFDIRKCPKNLILFKNFEYAP